MKNHRGFTLIELLIVVVIIGILAAIAMPKFANTKGKAFVARMRSDLRNLAGVQENYWIDQRTYYGGAVPNGSFAFQPSQGVTITILAATASGWSASAAAPGLTLETCFIYYGNIPPVPPAKADGAVACT
jgi:prepilin-type N-terminal cleavage/methylation domain-containing protein